MQVSCFVSWTINTFWLRHTNIFPYFPYKHMCQTPPSKCSIKYGRRRYMQSQAKCGVLGLFLRKKNFCYKTEWNNNFRKFPFVAECNRAEFRTHLKYSFGVTAFKWMFTILLYMRRLLYMGKSSIKHTPPHPLASANSDVIHNFCYGVHF